MASFNGGGWLKKKGENKRLRFDVRRRFFPGPGLVLRAFLFFRVAFGDGFWYYSRHEYQEHCVGGGVCVRRVRIRSGAFPGEPVRDVREVLVDLE